MASGILSAVILVLASIISKSSCEDASVGISFQYELQMEDFSSGSSQPGAFIYKPSLVGMPGLPNWLSYLQTGTTHQSYVYGTPNPESIGNITLEIIALNTDTYKSARVKVPISITEQPDPPSYLATFLLSNHNVEDMLPVAKQREFLDSVRLVWSTETPLVMHKLSPPSDTSEFQATPSPDQKGKRGVHVVVGSTTPFSSELRRTFDEALSDCGNKTYEPFRLADAFKPEFSVDWCSLELTHLDRSDESSATKPLVLGDEYTPPALTSDPPDHLIEFLLIVVPPLAVALIFVIVLGILMCTFRGRSKTSMTRTPEIQLTHHQGIRQASRQLRALSNRRDGTSSSMPTTPIIPHGANPAFSSLQSSPRHHIRDPDALPMTSTPLFSHTPPPPYRVPHLNMSTPTTPGNQETSFSDAFDNRRLSEPGNHRGRQLPSPIRSPPPFMSGTSARAGASTS